MPIKTLLTKKVENYLKKRIIYFSILNKNNKNQIAADCRCKQFHRYL